MQGTQRVAAATRAALYRRLSFTDKFTDSGGGMEWVNHAYNSVIANTDDGDSFWMANLYALRVVQDSGRVYSANGGGQLCEDGDVYGRVWGGYLG